MKIDRAICRQVNCPHFTDHKKPGLRFRSYDDPETLRPKIPKTGLCAMVVWHIYKGVFDDEQEVPHECKYKTEMAVTQ